MRFSRLRLAGFKSFVEPAELLIEPGLTGVVGPNGCGKSNLLEAIRWVMGEASARSLRGGGMDDVIFAGTVRRPSRGFAEVSLLLETDSGEREVTRRIERGAGSTYRLDGREVRARDVTLLFADAAAGAHSPALVSQGRIAAVIAAKPAERRQMLEEAAGIAGLHVRRREAEARLRATEENLTRLAELAVQGETRAASLRRQARAALRYRQLSAEIRVAGARDLFSRWRDAADEADRLKRAAAAATAEVDRAGARQGAASLRRVETAQALATARAEWQRLAEAEAELGRWLERLGRERAGVRRRLGEVAVQRDGQRRDAAREEALVTAAASAVARLADEGRELDDALAGAEGARAAIAREEAEAEAAVRDAGAALAVLTARLESDRRLVMQARAVLAKAQARTAAAVALLGRLAAERAALAEAAPLEARLAAARAVLAEGGERVAAAEAAVRAAEAAGEAAAAAVAQAQATSASARSELAAATSEARAVSAALARTSGVSLLDRLVVTTGYERALAAALGDDLSAPLDGDGPRGWRGAETQSGDPPLPAGLIPLSTWVDGVPALARRLAQVGVVDADGGQSLAVGQRLVTREGRLRRWDGYAAEGDGAAAADRLIRANRLAELERMLPDLRRAAEGADAEQAAAESERRTARLAMETARTARLTDEARLRDAQREEDALALALARRSAAADGVETRCAIATAERKAASSAEEEAAAALSAIPDDAAARSERQRAETRAAAARNELTERRRALATLDGEIAARRVRQRGAEVEAAGWQARGADAATRQGRIADRLAELAAEEAGLAERPAVLDRDVAALEEQARRVGEAARAAAHAHAAADAAAGRAEAEAAAATAGVADAREARAGSDARAEAADARRSELSAQAGERFGCSAPLLPERIGFPGAEVAAAGPEAARHDRLVAERERLGAVNLVAEAELAELEATRAEEAAQQAEIAGAVDRLRREIGQLNREGRERLRTAFDAVDGHFRRLFATLFAGGEAHLALTEADDPLDAGLEIMAQPPGKRLQSLTLLSGGEQALTAVALVFALFLSAPTPICVLDEVDAPLDDANTARFCDLLGAMSHDTDTRYLVVTHNPVTMARMDRLFGVTMVEAGVSRLVSVDLGTAERLAAE